MMQHNTNNCCCCVVYSMKNRMKYVGGVDLLKLPFSLHFFERGSNWLNLHFMASLEYIADIYMYVDE